MQLDGKGEPIGFAVRGGMDAADRKESKMMPRNLS